LINHDITSAERVQGHARRELDHFRVVKRGKERHTLQQVERIGLLLQFCLGTQRLVG